MAVDAAAVLKRSQRAAGILMMTALLAATLAACGGGSSSGSSGGGGGGSAAASDDNDAAEVSSSAASGGDNSDGSAPDPCGLLSADDLSTAYGTTFSAGAASTDGVAAERGFKGCKWDAANSYGSFLLQTVASGGGLGETASDLYDQSVGLYDGSTPGTAGDKSILLKDGGGFLAVQGDVFVQGNPIFVGGDPAPDAAAALLQTVVSKLS